MRICRVMRTYPRRGRPGPGLPGYELTRRIVRPTLYVTRAEPAQPLPVPAHAELHEVRAWDGVALSASSGVLGWQPGLKMLAYAAFFAGGVRRVVRWRPDLIHVHSLPGLLYGAVAARLLDVPWAFTFHGTELQRAIRRPIRGLVARADALCYVSEHMRPVLAAAFPGARLVHTPSGVDLDAFRPDPTAAREPTLVCIARFHWQKGHPDLAEALVDVFRAHPEHRLVAVGSGPGEATFRRLLAERRIADRVDVVPSMERDELAALLRRSALLLLPSVTEGFPKVVLEAMASGTPVVTTDTGCCAAVVGPAGAVVPPRDPAAFAAAVNRVLQAPDLDAMRCTARARARPYDWASTAARVEAAYREMLDAAAA